MKILISGASGLIGNELQVSLVAAGHKIVRLVRDKARRSSSDFFWNPETGEIDPKALEGVDGVVNLAGENIAGARWSKARKEKILKSRIDATKTLAHAITQMATPPKVFVSASAIGFYGDKGDEVCTEDTASGSGFLADVCRQWEAAAAPVAEKGVRIVYLRTGVVLSAHGGALAKMLPPFKLCLGGTLGSGKQYMSWIEIGDIVNIILFALTHNEVKGPINGVAPNPVTNYNFTKALGKVLGRPTFLPAPAFALRLLLGTEMADEFILSSTRVIPNKLEALGYRFHYQRLEEALQQLV